MDVKSEDFFAPQLLVVNRLRQHIYFFTRKTFDYSYHHEEDLSIGGSYLCVGQKCLACAVGIPKLDYRLIPIFSLSKDTIAILKVNQNEKQGSVWSTIRPFYVARKSLERACTIFIDPDGRHKIERADYADLSDVDEEVKELCEALDSGKYNPVVSLIPRVTTEDLLEVPRIRKTARRCGITVSSDGNIIRTLAKKDPNEGSC